MIKNIFLKSATSENAQVKKSSQLFEEGGTQYLERIVRSLLKYRAFYLVVYHLKTIGFSSRHPYISNIAKKGIEGDLPPFPLKKRKMLLKLLMGKFAASEQTFISVVDQGFPRGAPTYNLAKLLPKRSL